MQVDHILFPESILLDAYQKALKFIRRNYQYHKKKGSVEQSYLYLTLGPYSKLERYNWLEQAETVFSLKEKDPRYIEVNIFFNATRQGMPTIHITNPSEMEKNNALSIGEGFQNTIYEAESGGTEYRKVFNKRFVSKYGITITSDNTNEVVLIYQVMLAMSISLIEHLQLSGLENIKISGQEIVLKSDLVPAGIFVKSIGLEFERDVPAIQLSTNDLITDLDIEGNVTGLGDLPIPLSNDEVSVSGVEDED